MTISTIPLKSCCQSQRYCCFCSKMQDAFIVYEILCQTLRILICGRDGKTLEHPRPKELGCFENRRVGPIWKLLYGTCVRWYT